MDERDSNAQLTISRWLGLALHRSKSDEDDEIDRIVRSREYSNELLQCRRVRLHESLGQAPRTLQPALIRLARLVQRDCMASQRDWHEQEHDEAVQERVEKREVTKRRVHSPSDEEERDGKR